MLTVLLGADKGRSIPIMFWLAVSQFQCFIRQLSFLLSPFDSCCCTTEKRSLLNSNFSIFTLAWIYHAAGPLFIQKCQIDESLRNVVKQMWNGQILYWSNFCSSPASGFGQNLRAVQGFAWKETPCTCIQCWNCLESGEICLLRSTGSQRNVNSSIPKLVFITKQFIEDPSSCCSCLTKKHKYRNTNTNTGTNPNTLGYLLVSSRSAQIQLPGVTEQGLEGPPARLTTNYSPI